MIVLDARAAVEMALGSETGRALAKVVMEEDKVITCGLFPYEVANAFWKYVHAGAIDAETARTRLKIALDLVDEIVPADGYEQEALGEAVHRDHPTYDMFYLCLARRTGAAIMTMDKRLMDLCDESGVDRIHLLDLGC